MIHDVRRSESTSLVDPDAPVRRIGTGFTFTEGPLRRPAGHCLLFSGMPDDVRRRRDGSGGVREVWPSGFVCPNCGHNRCCQLTTHKLQQCYHCNRQASTTAGTIFEAAKLLLTVWFQGIYFMTQDKKGCSAMKLHRQLGISVVCGIAVFRWV